MCKEVFGIFRLIPCVSVCLNLPSRYNGILWIPSAQYKDPVTAFEEGLQWTSA